MQSSTNRCRYGDLQRYIRPNVFKNNIIVFLKQFSYISGLVIWKIAALVFKKAINKKGRVGGHKINTLLLMKVWRRGEIRLPDLWPGFKTQKQRSYVGWVCYWFSSLIRGAFLGELRFSDLLKDKISPQIPCSQERWKKNHSVNV